jgi:hypothetical protein
MHFSQEGDITTSKCSDAREDYSCIHKVGFPICNLVFDNAIDLCTSLGDL